MVKLNRRVLAAGSVALALLAAVPAMAQGKVLRFVQNGNLTILDPIWTTAYVTRDHGYMIYDTLFSTDANNAVQPQMVDKYEVSSDKLLWTFSLRDGLEWHDGKPVTPKFPLIPYAQALTKYGTDKPDLRNPLEIADVTIEFNEPSVIP